MFISSNLCCWEPKKIIIFNFFLCVSPVFRNLNAVFRDGMRLRWATQWLKAKEKYFYFRIKQFSNDWLSENDILENYNSRRPAEIKERTEVRPEPLPETWKLLFHQSLPANIPRDFHHVILPWITAHLSSSRFVEVRSNHFHTQSPRHEKKWKMSFDLKHTYLAHTTVVKVYHRTTPSTQRASGDH